MPTSCSAAHRLLCRSPRSLHCRTAAASCERRDDPLIAGCRLGSTSLEISPSPSEHVSPAALRREARAVAGGGGGTPRARLRPCRWQHGGRACCAGLPAAPRAVRRLTSARAHASAAAEGCRAAGAGLEPFAYGSPQHTPRRRSLPSTRAWPTAGGPRGGRRRVRPRARGTSSASSRSSRCKTRRAPCNSTLEKGVGRGLQVVSRAQRRR